MNNGRKLAGLLLAGTATVGAMGVGGGSAHADEPPTSPTAQAPTARSFDGHVEIRNLRTSGCVDVKGRSHAVGAIIRQYDCGVDQANQLWRLELVPGTTSYTMRNRESLQCLDIRSTAPVPPNRTVIEQDPCNTSKPTQRWQLRFIGFFGVGDVAAYNLVSNAGGKCLDLDDGSFGNDKRIQMWDCEGPGNDHQLWYFK